jgi:hypothetical protein
MHVSVRIHQLGFHLASSHTALFDGAWGGAHHQQEQKYVGRIQQQLIYLLILHVYHLTLCEHTSLERNEKNDDLTV